MKLKIEKVRYVVFEEPLVSWFLYMIISMGNYAIAIEDWSSVSCVGIVVAGAVGWKSFRSGNKDKKENVDNT